MANKTYTINSERQHFAVGLLTGRGLVDPTKKRALLIEYGFSDIEASFTILEQDLVLEAIKANEPQIRKGGKPKKKQSGDVSKADPTLADLDDLDLTIDPDDEDPEEEPTEEEEEGEEDPEEEEDE
jgi:hypothetical protein